MNQTTHEFFLGFWTMISLVTAAGYILIFCSERALNMCEELCDRLNDKIDELYGAVSPKLPNNTLISEI